LSPAPGVSNALPASGDSPAAGAACRRQGSVRDRLWLSVTWPVRKAISAGLDTVHRRLLHGFCVSSSRDAEAVFHVWATGNGGLGTSGLRVLVSVPVFSSFGSRSSCTPAGCMHPTCCMLPPLENWFGGRRGSKGRAASNVSRKRTGEGEESKIV
jgi:hypothetical protein